MAPLWTPLRVRYILTLPARRLSQPPRRLRWARRITTTGRTYITSLGHHADRSTRPSMASDNLSPAQTASRILAPAFRTPLATQTPHRWRRPNLALGLTPRCPVSAPRLPLLPAGIAS